MRGLKIVTITIGKRDKYQPYSDIVIDCLSDDDKRYFMGKNYSICQNESLVLEINEIVNLTMKLEWDSNFFGFNVAYLSCMHLTENIIYQVDKFIRKNNIRFVEYLCNCHDRESVIVAEKNGFNFVDIRLTYGRILREKKDVSLDNLIFDKATEKDIPRLRSISKNLYKESRYFFDKNFVIEKIYEFYESWVEKGILGQYDDECWCLYDNRVPIVFCTVRYTHIKSVVIGLFGVDPKYQRMGLGTKILYSVFNTLIDKNINKV